MKVALLNPIPTRRGAVNKDVSGGFGTVSDYGDSPVGRTLTWFKRRGVRYPVLSLGYVAAIFAREGWEIEYGEDAEAASDADVAIVYTSLVAHRAEMAIAEVVQQHRGIPVGFIGPLASVKPELFEGKASFVIAGEPESGIERLAKGEELPSLLESEQSKDLDSLPFPYWRPFGVERFRYRPYFPTGNGFFPILSSRGCSLSCSYYCPYTAVTGRSWRKRSVENVMAEIEHLVGEYGAHRILFRDPLFTLDRRRAEALSDAILESNLGVEWVCETHLDFLDEGLIDHMWAAGLRSIKVGIESGDPEVLRGVRRHQPKEDRIRRILGHCDKRGIGVVGFYILGLPQDTEESIEKTIEYAVGLNTLGAQFTIATPYPGTGFYDEMETSGRLLTDDWEKFDIYTPVLQHDNLTAADLHRLKANAYQRYYLRGGWAGKFMGHWWRRLLSNGQNGVVLNGRNGHGSA